LFLLICVLIMKNMNEVISMRSILITVMMLIVVAVIFVNVVSKDGGLQDAIEDQGSSAITRINTLYDPDNR